MKIPYEPSMEDLKMEFTTERGTKCRIFITDCKNRTEEEKQQSNQNIADIWMSYLNRQAAI